MHHYMVTARLSHFVNGKLDRRLLPVLVACVFYVIVLCIGISCVGWFSLRLVYINSSLASFLPYIGRQSLRQILSRKLLAGSCVDW